MIFMRVGNPAAILHYNVYFGVDVIGNWWQSYLNPLMGFLIMIVNFVLALAFYNLKERIASYILLLANLIVQFGLVITSVTVALINY